MITYCQRCRWIWIWVWLLGVWTVAAGEMPVAAAADPLDGQTVRFAQDLAAGRGLARIGRWNMAEGYFLAAEKIAPDRPDVVFYLGITESHLPGRQWKAIAWFRAYLALEGDPHTPAAARVRSEIKRLTTSAEVQAADLLKRLQRLAALLPTGPDAAYAAGLIPSYRRKIQRLRAWQDPGPNLRWPVLLRAWHWSLIARGVTTFPAIRAALATPFLLAKHKAAIKLWIQQRQELTCSTIGYPGWIQYIDMVTRRTPMSAEFRRYVQDVALKFYARQTLHAVAQSHFDRAMECAFNLIALHPNAYDFYYAAQSIPLNPPPHVAAWITMPISYEAADSPVMKAYYVAWNLVRDYAARYDNRARAKMRFRLYRGAARDYRLAIALVQRLNNSNFSYDSATLSLMQRLQSYQYSGLGYALYRQRHYARAKRAFATALVMVPNNSQARAGLVKIKAIALIRKTLAAMDQQLKMGGNPATICTARAALRLKLHDIPGALEDCSYALSRNPHFVAARLERMNIEAAQGDNQAAIADATSLLPWYGPTATLDEVYCTRGTCQVKLGHFAQAAADFSAALRANPIDLKARLSQMNIAVLRQEYSAATTDAAGVITLHPPAKAYAQAVAVLRVAAAAGSTTAMNDLGWLYHSGKVTPNYHYVPWSEPLFKQPTVRPGGLPVNNAKALHWFRQAAAKNSARGMAALGAMYLDGAGIRQDYTAARRWFERSAKTGCPDAMDAIGWLYADGYGAKHDDKKALAWFRRAGQAHSAIALNSLGLCYQNGRGVKKSYTQALQWYRLAWAAGSADGANNIGYFYATGKGVAKDPAKALAWYRKAADAGDPSAFANLGYCYQDGDGVPKDAGRANEFFTRANYNLADAALFNAQEYYLGEDGASVDYSRAVLWLRRGVALGDARAMDCLGVMYRFGRGVPQDSAQAIYWYRRAAHRGNALAMHNLAIAYYRGRGVAPNYVRAMTWWRRAVRQQQPYALCWIGNLYFDGHARPFSYAHDYQDAMVYWRKAASAGDTHAMANISMLYKYGWGVKVSHFQAMKWLSKTGDAQAVYQVGRCYDNGDGVASSGTKAAQWYRSAAQQGVAAAMIALADDYSNGVGVPQNSAKFIKWIRAAIKHKSARAMEQMGEAQVNGIGVSKNSTKAIYWFRKAIAAGWRGAYLSIGRLYAEGPGLAVNYSKALHYFRKGAARGSADCMLWIGNCYKFGLGVRKNKFRALQWYARSGEVWAQNQIGFDYYMGTGVPKDYKLAVHWFRKAANAGNATAMYNMGYCYLHGYGVAARNYKAIQWFTWAADKGSTHAMMSLASLYRDTKIDGLKIDYYKVNLPKAISWYRKAAARGNSAAMSWLGSMYKDGQGVPQDYRRAMDWYRKAAVAGNAASMSWMAYFYGHGLGVPINQAKALQWQARYNAAMQH